MLLAVAKAVVAGMQTRMKTVVSVSNLAADYGRIAHAAIARERLDIDGVLPARYAAAVGGSAGT